MAWAFKTALTLCFFATAATAGTITGRVTRVIDGDTIEILVDRQPTRVRLAEIDAPEKKCGQPFNEAARLNLASMVAGKPVEVRISGHDRYGRSIGRVFSAGQDVNAAQVRAGFAWQYRAYSADLQLSAQEVSARNARRGLWSDPRPIAPWTWRHDLCRQAN